MSSTDSSLDFVDKFDPKLDVICDEFEAEWKACPETPPDIREFLGDWADCERAKLLLELISVDMEYRWRAAEPMARKTLVDYVRDWPELGSSESLPLELIQLEQQLRQVELGSQCGVSNAESVIELYRGARFEQFKLLELLGSGSFGEVWKARDDELNRDVAIKFPLGSSMSERGRDNFMKEARAAARSQHPYIVRVHEIGRANDTVYVVTDFVDGPDLAEWLVSEKPGIREAAALCLKIADALQHAHELGIVHRDVKPANVLLQTGSSNHLEPRITDFGLALNEDELHGRIDGKTLGSPAYMSPEQAEGRSDKVDQRADIYSLGVILFELITGERPFRGTSSAILEQVIEDPAPDPRRLNADVNLDLSTICLKCLEKSPERRYATARDLHDDLVRFMRGVPIQARAISRTERAWRWIKRNRTVSSLTVGLLLVLSFGLLVASWQWRRAEHHAEQMRQSLYVSELNLVERAWRQGNIDGGLQVLKRWRPRNGEADLRGFAWKFWWKRFHSVSKSTDLRFEISDIVVSPNKTTLAVVGQSGSVVLLDCESQRRLSELKGHKVRVNTAQFIANDRLLTGAVDGELRLWNTKSRQCLKPLRFSGKVTTIAVNPSRQIVAIGRDNGTVEIRSIDLKLIDTIQLNHDRVSALVFHPRKDELAIAVASGRMSIWSLVDSRPNRLQAWSWNRGVGAVCWSPDGNLVAATGGTSADAAVWNAASGERVLYIEQPWHQFVTITFSADGESLLLGGDDTFIQRFDVNSGALLDKLVGHAHRVTKVLVLPEENKMLSASVDGTVRQWRLNDNDSLIQPPLHEDSVKSVAFSPDSRTLASVGYDRSIQLFDMDSRQLRLSIPHSNKMLFVEFSQNGRMLATADADGHITLWDPSTGDLIRRLDAGAEVCSLAFSSDDRLLVGGCSNGRLVIWSPATAEKLAERDYHEQSIFAVDASPTHGLFATGSWDRRMLLWSFDTLQPIAEFKTDGMQKIVGVQFSPDGGTLASTERRVVRLWDVATRSQRATLMGHNHHVNKPAFSPDGMTLATGGWDETVKLWDLRTNLEKASFHVKGNSNGVTFSPNGHYLASCGTGHPFLTIWVGE